MTNAVLSSIEFSYFFPFQSHDDFPSLNLQATESSKDDECNAICKLHGVEASSPLPLQLKAIDKEYHSCIAAGQSAKADHVMELFVWKSKQASQVCRITHIVQERKIHVVEFANSIKNHLIWLISLCYLFLDFLIMIQLG